MHSLDITDALVEFLSEALSEMRLQTKDENVWKAPMIFDGYLPPKQNTRARRGEEVDEQEDYPFVIVRYLGEEDELFNRNTMQFRFLIGTYSKDEQHGWRDTLNVMNRIKIALKEAHMIGNASLTGKITSTLFEEQMRPMWHGVLEVEFETPQVQINRSVFPNEF